MPLVRSRKNHLVVRAYINGRPAWLGVDSGAPVSAIALDRREHFRLTQITAKSNLPARIQINGGVHKLGLSRDGRPRRGWGVGGARGRSRAFCLLPRPPP